MRLFHSMDHPIQRFVVVHGGIEPSVNIQINHIKHANVTGGDFVEVTLQRWPGVSEGWNAVLQACPAASWIMLLNIDIEVRVLSAWINRVVCLMSNQSNHTASCLPQFTPGALSTFSRAFSSDIEQQKTDFGEPTCIEGSWTDAICGFRAFALTRHAISTVGLFDEVRITFVSDNR
jgi:hypothetical protein